MSSLPDSKEVTIAVENLGLTYKTRITKTPNFKEAIVGFGRREKSVVSVDALKGITFNVKHGTVLGIIGANGAGIKYLFSSWGMRTHVECIRTHTRTYTHAHAYTTRTHTHIHTRTYICT